MSISPQVELINSWVHSTANRNATELLLNWDQIAMGARKRLWLVGNNNRPDELSQSIVWLEALNPVVGSKPIGARPTACRCLALLDFSSAAGDWINYWRCPASETDGQGGELLHSFQPESWINYDVATRQLATEGRGRKTEETKGLFMNLSYGFSVSNVRSDLVFNSVSWLAPLRLFKGRGEGEEEEEEEEGEREKASSRSKANSFLTAVKDKTET